ncbi:MAG TPA: HIT domain-containing protein [Firmicutes bacterium]|jgi:histidine triad (HIT) family protein|nr:HIT domain-containing protein [Bacillota bacterium]
MVSACVFCQIVRREIPAQILLETEEVLAFKDIKPVAPIHIVLIPKKHISSVMDPQLPTVPSLTAELFAAIQQLMGKEEAKDGFRVVINRGAHAGESVPHLHLHLIGGRELAWPPG